jgi:hypothetical protein
MNMTGTGPDGIGILSIIEHAVASGLYGARVIGAIRKNVDIHDDYWEVAFEVARQHEDQCGTHRVHVNSEERSACFSGHYNMTEKEALNDMLARAMMVPA